MARSFSALLLAALIAAGQEPLVHFATYFGGGEGDFGNSIATGPGGDIWIAGVTHSRNFPVLAAHQSRCTLGSLQSCQDGFLARLSADGRSVRFSTYLGDSTNDEITALAVDERGYAYVTGTYRDGALAARFDPDGRAVYVHSFGGPLITRGRALAIDGQGNLYLAGQTSSPGFPAVNPIQSGPGPVSCMAIGGGGIPIDIVVMKIDPGGRVIFSTYLSGNGNDFGNAIAVDALGRIYVAGGTTSTNLPLPNAMQANYGGGPPQPVGTCDPGDGFVLQISPAGGVLFGTLLGGAGADNIDNLFVGTSGILTVTGTTNSGASFPLADPLTEAPTAANRAFAARIDVDTPSMLHARLFDQSLGTGWMSQAGNLTLGTRPLLRLNTSDWRVRQLADFGAAVQRSLEAPEGPVLAIGSAGSRDSFRPTNPIQTANAGFDDVWFAKFTPAPDDRVTTVNAASFAGPEIAPGSIATLFSPESGDGVRVQGLTARVLASSGNQINIVVPEDAPPGSTAEIVVLRDGQPVATGSALFARVAPAIFTANANGRGAPAAQLLRVSREGTRTEQSPFLCDPTCSPAPIDAGSEDVQSFLTLYGTGIRNRTSLDRVKAVIAGEEVAVQFAGSQPVFSGLDQVNISLPATLRGRGEVDLVLVVDGRLSNVVRLNIR
ncbi:MAG: SBBP repeat-containing protein [Acidobacteriia bacterium]|nr:SBBP repeat-containing protein [Terriglobia bacterium]